MCTISNREKAVCFEDIVSHQRTSGNEKHLSNVFTICELLSYIYSSPGKDRSVHYFSKGCVLCDTFCTLITCAFYANGKGM